MIAKDLTTGSIRKHMSQLALPSILGSLFTTLYNVVDTLWAGKVGLDLSHVQSLKDFMSQSGDIRALTGMTVSFPIFLIILALSIGLMSGTLAILGNALGRKDYTQVQSYFAQAITYAAVISILFLGIIPLLPTIFHFIGAKDPLVSSYAYEYISTLILGNSLFAFRFVFAAALIARGDTITQRNIDIFNFFLNIVLDPLFLFGFGPIPAMGLRGIAIATLLAQFTGLLMMFVRLRQYQAFSTLHWRSFLPKWDLQRKIGQQSVPPALNMMAISLLMGMVNRYASIHGGAPAVAAYGISLRIEQIALIPSMGVRTALASIASQNNGADEIGRIQRAYRTALVSGLLFLLLIMVPLGWFFSRQVAYIFTTDPQTIQIAEMYLHVCVLTFYAYMLITFCAAIFQATQVPQISTMITIGRNILLPLFTFVLFPTVLGLGLNGLWYAILFNNWLAAVVSLLLYAWIIAKRKRQTALKSAELEPVL